VTRARLQIATMGEPPAAAASTTSTTVEAFKAPGGNLTPRSGQHMRSSATPPPTATTAESPTKVEAIESPPPKVAPKAPPKVPPLPNVSAARRAQLQKAFGTFDTDGSGSLSADELATILSMGGAKGPEEAKREALEVISKYDADGNGVLDVSLRMHAERSPTAAAHMPLRTCRCAHAAAHTPPRTHPTHCHRTRPFTQSSHRFWRTDGPVCA
jgi:hypothetical protein